MFFFFLKSRPPLGLRVASLSERSNTALLILETKSFLLFRSTSPQQATVHTTDLQSTQDDSNDHQVAGSMCVGLVWKMYFKTTLHFAKQSRVVCYSPGSRPFSYISLSEKMTLAYNSYINSYDWYILDFRILLIHNFSNLYILCHHF